MKKFLLIGSLALVVFSANAVEQDVLVMNLEDPKDVDFMDVEVGAGGGGAAEVVSVLDVLKKHHSGGEEALKAIKRALAHQEAHPNIEAALAGREAHQNILNKSLMVVVNNNSFSSEFLTILLDAGADPNAMVEDKLPLNVLLEGRGDLERIRILLRHGADPNIQDKKENSACGNYSQLIRMLWLQESLDVL